MPVKPLPEKVVRRLTEVIARHGIGILNQLHAADSRMTMPWTSFQYMELGGRVRVVEVRGFGNVALKFSHDGRALEVIGTVKSLVQRHNDKWKGKRLPYVLLMPHGHAVHESVIAMQYLDRPTASELMRRASLSTVIRSSRLLRGIFAGGRMHQNRVGDALHEAQQAGLSDEKLRECCRLASENSGVDQSHLLFVRMQKRRPVFVPLFDLI